MLVPADKASNNVIVVCKNYYLDVVIKDLNLNNTYKEVHNNSVNIISRHLDYMVKNDIDVQDQHEQLPSFYWLPKLKKPYGSRYVGSSNPDSWSLLGSKTLSITLCTVSRRAIGSFGTEAILSIEACQTRRFVKEVVSSSS